MMNQLKSDIITLIFSVGCACLISSVISFMYNEIYTGLFLMLSGGVALLIYVILKYIWERKK